MAGMLIVGRRRAIALAAAGAVGGATAVLVGAGVGGQSATGATTPPGGFANCRASVVRLAVQGLPVIEPVVANGNNDGTDQPFCTNQISGLPTTPLGPVTLTAAQAQTTIVPASATTGQQVTAHSQAATVDVNANGGAIVIHANAVDSRAQGTCVSGQPQYSGTSDVTDLTINGQTLTADTLLANLASAIDGSPLSTLARIYINRQLPDPSTGGIIQRAAEVDLLNTATGSTVTLVLGEAKVSNPCGAANPVTTVTTTTTTTTAGPTNTVTAPPTTVTSPPATVAVPVPVPVPVPSGNNGVLGSQQTIRPNGINGGTCGHLTMRFVRAEGFRPASAHSATSRYGTRTVVRGRIVNCRGVPIVKARIDVVHSFDGHTLTKTGLRSRRGGALTLILPLNVTTRTLRFIYRGNLDSGNVTSQVLLHLRVVNAHGSTVHSHH